MTFFFKHLLGRVFLSLTLLLLMHACVTFQAHAAGKRQELLIGIEPEHNIFDQVRRYRVLAGYLSDQLGLEVKLTVASRFGEIVNRFRSLHLDGAVLSSYTTELAIRELGLTPVVSLVNENNSSASHGLILVREDSGIENVNDMRGKTVAFVDPATTEGYVYARAYFFKHDVEDLDSFFSRQSFTGSHASTVFTVLDGRAEIGSAKDTVFEELVRKDPFIRNELSIIAKSQPVPEVTLCIKNDLDPKLLEKLRTSLLTMDQSVEGHRVLKELGASRFIPAAATDFSIVSEMLEEAGLSLSGSGNNE